MTDMDTRKLANQRRLFRRPLPMRHMYKRLGKRIKRLRVAAYVSRRDLARILEIPYRTLRTIETSPFSYPVTPDLLVQISDVVA